MFPIKDPIHVSETTQGREVQYIYYLFVKQKKEDKCIRIEKRVCLKSREFFLFSNHDQLVNSKIKVIHVSQFL